MVITLRHVLVSLFTATIALAVGCDRAADVENTFTLATTTSTQDSGLLDVLLPEFREQTGVEVKVVAVGSGQALELGRRGDADLLLTHAPADEKEFMEEGWGEERRPVMHNDFVLVGPGTDPAAVRGETSVVEAFSRVADRETVFVSRGDDSGTHQKELEIWKKAGREPTGKWYIDAGIGMAAALRMADEKRAYTLADRGTFLALQKDVELEILSEHDPLLQNNYSVILVNSRKHPHIRAAAARRFADFLTDPVTKARIADFGVEEFGQPLFFPE
jgi:tungstate transport system substrate-binding protein